MPKLAAAENTVLNGRIVLSQRSRSAAWQARFKVGDRWVRVSTKQRDKQSATKAAEELYLEAQFKHKHAIPVQTRRFDAVAQLAVKSMEAALKGGQGKKVYNDYIIAIKRYLIPFFGKHHVHRIDYGMLKEFEDWRIKKMGKQPKASSIGTHNSALNRVFDEAIERGWITQSQRPELFNRGNDGERRPDFTLSEYRRLHQGLRYWAAKSRKGKTRDMRELLRDYVLILANTGIRHGTEAQNLQWRHIRIEKDTASGKSMLLMNVNGKTGRRELVARNVCITYLKRIHQRSDKLKHLSFKELLNSNSEMPVFALPDGEQTDNLRATFRSFLKDHKLLKCPRTDKNRTLYSLRHTYATFALTLSKTDIHLLAKQMGTSIAMIEAHYSHLVPRMRSSDLSGKERGEFAGY